MEVVCKLEKKFFVQSFLDGAVLNKVRPKFLKVRKTVLQESGLSLSCHRVEECQEDKLLVPDGF